MENGRALPVPAAVVTSNAVSDDADRLGRGELLRRYDASEFRQAFVDLWTIRTLMSDSIVGPDYVPSSRYADAIVLTEIGDALRAELATLFPAASSVELTVAPFLQFAFRSLLVDVERSNPQVARAALDADILENRIAYPWMFGQQVYQNFHGLNLGNPEELDPEQTASVLQGTPRGVFQLNNVVVGPFGALLSLEPRDLPPRRQLPLRNCPDLSCRGVHQVTLHTTPSGVSRLSAAAIGILSHGLTRPPSEWDRYFAEVSPYHKPYDHLDPESIPWLLGQALSRAERKHPAAELLDQGGDLRARLPSDRATQRRFQRSGESVVEPLGEDEILQLLLLASDEQVTRTLEECVLREHIKVPSGEVRSSRLGGARGGWFRVDAELSRLGIRLDATSHNPAGARLRALVRHVYAARSGLDDLDWDLRHVAGRTSLAKLDLYVQSADPRTVIRDLVMSDRRNLAEAFAFLRFGSFATPTTEQEESDLIDRIVWKLGYEVPVYPRTAGLFRKRLADWQLASDAGNSGTEDEVRKAGSLVFVSLEEVLDLAVAFSAWALSSDHPKLSRFVFNPDEARRAASLLLRDHAPQFDSDGHELVLDPSGVNTLSTLTASMSGLTAAVRKLVEIGAAASTRSTSEIPGYAKSRIIEFPFLHTKLLYDLDPLDLAAFLEHLDAIVASLARANVLGTRNLIDHHRERLPSAGEIDSAVSTLTRMLDSMESVGSFPTPVALRERRSDELGRYEATFADYRGRTNKLFGPPWIGSPWPAATGLLILVPGLTLNETAQPLRFHYEPSSEFRAMWSGYPIREPDTPIDAPEGSEQAPTLSQGA